MNDMEGKCSENMEGKCSTCATYMKRHDIIFIVENFFAFQHCNKTFRQNIDLYNTKNAYRREALHVPHT